MITPTTVNFTYKKFDTIPPAVILFHEYSFGSIPFIPLPAQNFIQIYDPTLTSVKLRLLAPGVDALPIGLNTFSIPIQLYDNENEILVTVGTITLNITIEDTIILQVSPINISFAFEIGSTTPNNKLISVTAENAWTVTKTQAWLSLSATSGTNSGIFEIGVITTGLSPGSYTDTVVVNDGTTTRNIAVTFTVTDPNSGTDFAYIFPELLKFGFTIGGSIPPAKNIEINVSVAWTATTNVSWLTLPTASGALGTQVIQTALLAGAALTALTEGIHFGIITFTVGTIVKTIEVELEVYDFTAQAPSSSELLFTDSDNILALESSRLDTFMFLKFVSTYKSKLFNYFVKLPFFKGGATRNIGVIPKKIIGEQPLIGLAEFSVFQPYFPLKLNINLSEKEFLTESIVATSTVSNLSFIKGSKPTGNFISEISKTMFLTKKATLIFSVLSNNVTSGIISITGAITKIIDVSENISANKEFYTVVIPIEPLGEFREGHELNFTFLGETVKVVIVDEDIDRSMIYWENEWGCWDALELRGEVYIEPGIKRSTANFRISENRTKNKVLQVFKPTSYNINTGVVHTKEELEMMHKMLCAKNIYLQTQGFMVPVIPKNTKVPTYRTLQILKGFDINFNHAEE